MARSENSVGPCANIAPEKAATRIMTAIAAIRRLVDNIFGSSAARAEGG
jgi:hypothetical protein